MSELVDAKVEAAAGAALAAEEARAADTEAAEAQQLVDEFEAKLRDGDQSITSDELGNRKRIAEFARLRAEGAAKRRQRADAAAVVANARAAVGDAADLLELDAELVARFRQAVSAIDELITTALQRSGELWRTQNELQAHGYRLQHRAGSSLEQVGVFPSRHGSGPSEAGYRIPGRGVDVHDVAPNVVLAEAISAGNRRRLDVGEGAMTLSGRAPLADSHLARRITGWNDAAKQIEQERS